MLCRRAVDSQGLAFIAQFACVAGCASDVQVLRVTARVLMAGESYGQIGRIGRAGLLRGIN